jgi:hypothetical protein
MNIGLIYEIFLLVSGRSFQLNMQFTGDVEYSGYDLNLNSKSELSVKLLKLLMRFFTSLRYVQNDNTLALEEGAWWQHCRHQAPSSKIICKSKSF